MSPVFRSKKNQAVIQKISFCLILFYRFLNLIPSFTDSRKLVGLRIKFYECPHSVNIYPLRTKIYCIGGLIYTATAYEDILHRQTKYIFIFNVAGLANCGHSFKFLSNTETRRHRVFILSGQSSQRKV